MALYLLYRGILDRRYFAGLRERLGFLPHPFETTGPGAIWFHAVSVGEILSAVTLIRHLREQQPEGRIYVSTATLAGRTLADEKLGALADGVFFAPLDYRSVVRRVLRRLRPALVVVLETEIWPNLYRESKRAGASLLIVNGRISDRALPRYRRWSGFFKHVLCWPDAILVQSEEDRRRYQIAGAPGESVTVAGNVKYDFTPPAAGIAPEIAAFLDRAAPREIWIAASTMPPAHSSDIDEDDVVIAAIQRLQNRKGLLTILAPRRPERFDVAAGKLKSAGIPFVRRSEGLSGTASVLLLDTIGELAALFERADVVFMGGTLAERGGHNILEPAFFGKPVIVGPHMENFSAIAAEFHAAGALKRIDSSDEVSAAVAELLDDPRSIGEKSRELAMGKRGVAARIAEEIWRAYDLGVPNPPHLLITRVSLMPMQWLWRAGQRVKMSRDRKARRELKTPVVSIGGVSMGGAGKSPMAAHIAARLREAGGNPAVLTRGYRRRSAQPIVIVPRGAKAGVALTGDEAQILIHAGDAHVGIGADRFAVGQRMEQELAPDLFLLDDGFQHVRLDRRHDVVLIDALDPLAGGLFPLGRLREPMASLARAHTIVITRARTGHAGIEKLIRRYNRDAPVFRSYIAPREWVDVEWGTARPAAAPKFGRAAAFCGLGSPRSFWSTIEDLRIEIAFRWAFRDHHQYRPAELKRLAQQAAAAGAEILLTTEKDLMNLCDGATALVAPLKIFWLKIGIEIEREEEFLRRIL